MRLILVLQGFVILMLRHCETFGVKHLPLHFSMESIRRCQHCKQWNRLATLCCFGSSGNAYVRQDGYENLLALRDTDEIRQMTGRHKTILVIGNF